MQPLFALNTALVQLPSACASHAAAHPPPRVPYAPWRPGRVIPFNIIDRPFLRVREHAVGDGGYGNLKPRPSEAFVGGRPVVVCYNDQPAAMWTDNPNSILAAIYGAMRIGMPLTHDKEFVIDIANGYRAMHDILHNQTGAAHK